MMRRLVFFTLLLAGACAQAAEGTDRVTAQAQIDLERSMKDLAALRDTIKTAKVPLATELGALEERLTKTRDEYEQSARLLDTRNLDVNNLKVEMKARQDENIYLANVMDEYARGLEARVHLSEMQRLGPVIEEAKSALANDNLSVAQKFERQIAVLKTSLSRIDDLIGGARFPGTAVDAEGVIQQGKFALVGPVAMFAADSGSIAGLALAQTGSPNPLIRPLEPVLTAGIAQIVSSADGILPLDPSRGSALAELMNRGSLLKTYLHGGPIMHPLLLCSVIALGVVLERLIFLFNVKRTRSLKAREAIFDALEAGDLAGAAAVSAKSKDFVARALTYALNHRQKSISDGMSRAAGLELERFNRGIVMLETIITLAPLLGLLGTIIGMMASFDSLGGAELGAPSAITGGIAEALIATAFGLGIAITSVVPMNWLVSAQEHARHEMEDAGTHLELLAKPLLEVEDQLARASANVHPKLINA